MEPIPDTIPDPITGEIPDPTGGEPGGLEDQVDDVPWGNTKEDEDDHGHRDERYGAKRQPPREERPHETPYRSSQTSWKRA